MRGLCGWESLFFLRGADSRLGSQRRALSEACSRRASPLGFIIEEHAVARVEAMTKEEEFERRLAAVEQAVAEIQR